MRTVSDNYNPYTVARRCNIRVSLEMVDIDARETAESFSENSCEISDITQTHNNVFGMEKKYAALEDNYWILDGSCVLPDKNIIEKEQRGWWSEDLSDENGVFLTPPSLLFSWKTSQSSVGFTVFFDDKGEEYPTVFRVRAFDAEGKLIADKTFSNEEVKCEVLMPVENYLSLELSILKTSKPYRRARISEVMFGVIKEFSNANIVNAEIDYSFSPMGESLPASELTVTVDNSDAAWNMANPEGIYAFLQETQPVRASLIINGESVDMGQYYFAKASAEDDSMTAKITAYDKAYWLDSVKYKGGSDGTWTFGLAVSTVVSASGIALSYTMPREISNRVVGKSLPKDISCREAICHLALAARCSVFMDREETLVFFDPLSERKATDELTFDVMERVPKITVANKISGVELTGKNEYTESEDEIWTALEEGVSGIIEVAGFESPVMVEGNDAAEWILKMQNRRLTYSIEERGNPAREIGDVVWVHDAYGNERKGIVTKESYSFDGGLSCGTEVWG